MTVSVPSLQSAAEGLTKSPWREDYFEISPVRAFAHPEGDYATQHNLEPANLDARRGVAHLLGEEPCGEGFLLMGTLAQFIPVVMAKANKPLSNEHARMIQDFCQTMQFYLRRDVDKSTAEDKHLFRVDEIMKWGAQCGLSTSFFANAALPQFVHSTPGASTPFDIYKFFKQYLQYCMNFGPDLIAAFDREFAPYVKFVQDSAAGWSGPHFSGVFLCKKTPPAPIQGDTRF
jgi:hypothetical protein